MSGVVKGVVVMRCDAGDWFAQAGEVTDAGEFLVEADAEVTHDNLRSCGGECSERGVVPRAVRVMSDESSWVLMGKDLVESGAGGLRDVNEAMGRRCRGGRIGGHDRGRRKRSVDRSENLSVGRSGHAAALGQRAWKPWT